MKKNRLETTKEKVIVLVDQMNEEQVTDLITVTEYMLELSKQEFKKFKALSRTEDFSVKEFAKNLRESASKKQSLLQGIV